MFSLYELAGVVTNLAAGLLGARWGIKTTLILGAWPALSTLEPAYRCMSSMWRTGHCCPPFWFG